MSRLGQVALMAAIVAVMLYLPSAVFFGVALDFAGVSPMDVLTFGGVLNAYAGALAWWLIFFAAALVYAVFAFPH